MRKILITGAAGFVGRHFVRRFLDAGDEVHAVDDVDLQIFRKEVLAIVGSNGAGKTTFVDALTGFVPSRGVIRFAGEEIQDLPAHQRARRGLGRTWQSLELFEDLTVRDNLMVAAENPKWFSFITDVFRPGRKVKAIEEQVDWALDIIGINDLADKLPSDLSHGQRKLVSVSRALAARPKLVLLDEPAAGLSSGESVEMTKFLMRLDPKLAILLIEHDMDVVFDLAHQISVLHFGEVLETGTPEQIKKSQKVQEIYLGTG